MFRKRRSSQKPDEGLYAAFRQSFPNVGPGTTTAPEQDISGSTHHRTASMSEAVTDAPAMDRHIDTIDEVNKDTDTTPKPYTDQWRLMTPSLMDPNSYAFSAFANQTPGYYTPTPGGLNTFYHSSAAGDLHTPGMGMNTPLSIPHSMTALHAADASLQSFSHFNHQLLGHSHAFQDAFHQQTHQPQSLFAPPGHFLQHQDSGYAGLDDSPHKTTPTQKDIQNLQAGSHALIHQFTHPLALSDYPSAEKFRFQTTLNAPTAMVRHDDEIPITYLNKGQAYTMSIFDTAPPNVHPGIATKYRTFVRVSFEDEQQRAKPDSCWQLWKEGRGSNEAHQRGGRLLAVEYVDPNQGGDEELRRSNMELEKASFDGFAVTWYPNSRVSGAPDCTISVRFNFLSTDFSHSKGVKGIPVRLCAKTQLISAIAGSSNEPEVCFSKVKLFRDHGAERKLSNDVAHVKKTIDKLKQQITQAESGMGNVGKRKRSGSMAAKEAGKLSAEEDLHMKLASLQDMFSSTRPASILFLKGDPGDDPDDCPVTLPGGEEIKAAQRSETWASRQSGSASPSSNVSPTPSSAPLTPKRKFSDVQGPDMTDELAIEEASQSPGRPVKIQKREHDSDKDEVIALDVDDSYTPPVNEKIVKPIACFYVRQKGSSSAYYRAIYLFQRSVNDLVQAIAQKFSIAPHRVKKVTHINSRGIQIVVDEEVVEELPEGQDMIVEFLPCEASEVSDVKHELLSPLASNSAGVNSSDMDLEADTENALEMWLNY